MEHNISLYQCSLFERFGPAIELDSKAIITVCAIEIQQTSNIQCSFILEEIINESIDENIAEIEHLPNPHCVNFSSEELVLLEFDPDEEEYENPTVIFFIYWLLLTLDKI